MFQFTPDISDREVGEVCCCPVGVVLPAFPVGIPTSGVVPRETSDFRVQLERTVQTAMGSTSTGMFV